MCALVALLGALTCMEAHAGRKSYENVGNERVTTQIDQLQPLAVPDGGASVLLLASAFGALLFGRKMLRR